MRVVFTVFLHRSLAIGIVDGLCISRRSTGPSWKSALGLCSDILKLSRSGFALPGAARALSYARTSGMLAQGANIPAPPRSSVSSGPARADSASYGTSQVLSQQSSTSVHPSAAGATRLSPDRPPRPSSHSVGLAQRQQGNGNASQQQQAWAMPMRVGTPAAPPSLPDSEALVRSFHANCKLVLLLGACFACCTIFAS
jgi:hypothetical protein